MKSILIFCLLFCTSFVWGEKPVHMTKEQIADEHKKSEKQDEEAKKAAKGLVDSTAESLKKKGQKVNSQNFAKELNEKFKQEKQTSKDTEEMIKKIEKIDPSVSDDKFKNAVLDILEGKTKKEEKIVCSEDQAACSTDKDCCSGLICATYFNGEHVIEKPQEGELPKGRLEFRCLKPVSLNQECTPFKNACKEGACILYSYNSTTLPICVPKDNACKKNEECCTGRCSSGFCENVYRCQNCKAAGEIPKDKEVCCEGYYKDENGKCVTDYPPSPPVTYSPVKFFKTIFDLILPSAEAQVVPTPAATPDPNANMETCYFNSKRTYYAQQYANSATADPSTGFGTIGNATKVATKDAYAFEFFYSGNGVNDFFAQNGGMNMFNRGKAIANGLKGAREANDVAFRELDRHMKCNCLAIKWEKLTPGEKNTFEAGQTCAEYSSMVEFFKTPNVTANKNETGSELVIDPDGKGAAGLKYQEMMIAYYSKRIQIQLDAFQNTQVGFSDLAAMASYVRSIPWQEKVIDTETSTRNRFKTWIEIGVMILVDFFTSIVQAIWGPFFQWLQNLFTSIRCQGVYSNFQQDFPHPNPQCSTSSYQDHCWHGICAGKTYVTTCTRYQYKPNAICGIKGRNAHCMKSAYKRTDHGVGGQNVYLIDPVSPIGYTGLNLDMNIVSQLDFNDKNKLCSFNPPNFTDAHYNGILQTAATWARTNQLYETDAENDDWAKYAVDNHLMAPHTSRSREMNYDLPGLASYYEDLHRNFGYILRTNINNITNDIDQLGNWSNEYDKTVNKLGKNTTKTVSKKIEQFKKNIKLAEMHLANVKAMDFSQSAPLTSTAMGSSLSGESLSSFYGGLNKLSEYNKRQQKKYDHYMKTVGNTPKGQALINAKKAMQAGLVGASPSGSSGGMGFGMHPDASKAGGSKTTTGAGKKEEKAVEEEYSDTGSNRGGDGDSSGKKANYATDNEIKDQRELEHVLNEAKSNMYDAQDGDTLWVIVTKAYVRGGYPRLLKVKPTLETKTGTEAPAEDEKSFTPTKSKKRKIKDDLKTLDDVH